MATPSEFFVEIVPASEAVLMASEMPLTETEIRAALPFVDMSRGISGWCDGAIQGMRPHTDHGWCGNRNERECHCDCPCHWSIERYLERVGGC